MVAVYLYPAGYSKQRAPRLANYGTYSHYQCPLFDDIFHALRRSARVLSLRLKRLKRLSYSAGFGSAHATYRAQCKIASSSVKSQNAAHRFSAKRLICNHWAYQNNGHLGRYAVTRRETGCGQPFGLMQVPVALPRADIELPSPEALIVLSSGGCCEGADSLES